MTADIKALAQSFGPQAVKKLAQLAGLEDGVVGADSDVAKISAMKELLDRGFGKSTQIIAGDEDAAPIGISMKVNFVRAAGTRSRPS